MTYQKLAEARWAQFRAYLDAGFNQDEAMRLLLHDSDLLAPPAAGDECAEFGHRPGDNLLCEVCSYDLAKPS